MDESSRTELITALAAAMYLSNGSAAVAAPADRSARMWLRESWPERTLAGTTTASIASPVVNLGSLEDGLDR